MRARIAGAFFLGFALGAVVIAAVLWSTGGLKTAAMRAQEKPLPAAPDPLKSVLGEAARESARPLNPPISALPQNLGQTDSGNVTPPLHLIVPVAGIHADSLKSTFHEDRHGHPHEALDISAPRGTPVLAAAEGNVVKLFKSKDGGLTVYQFDDSREYCFYYAHLDRYAPGLKEGVLLRPGDTLGYVGSTGDASPDAPHLHFAIFRLGPDKRWYQGTAIDPLPILRAK